MSMVSHIDSLKQKHSELEMRLQDALKHPSSSDDEIAELKRQKLALKDRIESIRD